MHILKLKRLVSLVLVAASCGSAVPVVTFADDGKGEPPAKPAATAKIEAPALLTERERWMLDRMEQLEKRVAELEAKGQPAVPSSSEPPHHNRPRPCLRPRSLASEELLAVGKWRALSRRRPCPLRLARRRRYERNRRMRSLLPLPTLPG